MNRRLLVALAVLAAVPALATTVVPRPLKDRARMADRVVLAQVLSTRTVAENGDPRRLLTLTEVLVGEAWKGTGPERLTVVQPGGSLGGWESRIPGDATFAPGETAVLLLRCLEPTRCVLVTLAEGKLQVLGADVLQFEFKTNAFRRRAFAEVKAELQAAALLPALPVPPVPGLKGGVAR